MDEELGLYFSQRTVLLTSDSTGLGQLKSHDRRLLTTMASGILQSSFAQKAGADNDLLEALDAELHTAILLVEARARLWPGELSRIQALLLEMNGASHCSAAWWLAAHYPGLSCPSAFPDHWQNQVWAAQALRRRDMDAVLPEPWLSWSEALREGRSILPAAQALWQAADDTDCRQWLAPLLVVADYDTSTRLINWLAPRTDELLLIKLMGISCQSRFLPWLADMQQNPDLRDAALREVRWLTGDQKLSHLGYQCWGEPLSATVWPRLFRSLPLGFRNRLWHWCWTSIEGAASSFQGGLWCAGN